MTKDRERSEHIQLFNESGIDIPLSYEDVRRITELVSAEESARFSLLEVAFVNENEILRLNREHLGHDYVTDIITFQYNEEMQTKLEPLEGTLYCCAQRIFEQAEEYRESPRAEFLRLVVHGLLHLCGYTDKQPEEREAMRKREAFYLGKLI
jgi:probable rRNA maturation factor